MRRLCLLTALTLLAIAPAATAKEVTGMKICGREGCAMLKHSLAQGFHDDASFYAGELTHDPGPVRWYRLAMLFGDESGETIGRVRLAYAPSVRAIYSLDAQPATPWQRVSAAGARRLASATGTLTPFAARPFAAPGPPEPATLPQPEKAPEADDGGIPRPLLAGVPAGALLLGLGLLLLRRR
jgi:hypothetical protein